MRVFRRRTLVDSCCVFFLVLCGGVCMRETRTIHNETLLWLNTTVVRVSQVRNLNFGRQANMLPVHDVSSCIIMNISGWWADIKQG